VILDVGYGIDGRDCAANLLRTHGVKSPFLMFNGHAATPTTIMVWDAGAMIT